MITPRDEVQKPLTEKETEAVGDAEAKVTAEALVPEAFEEPVFTGEDTQVAGLGKMVGKLIPGQQLRDALSPDPKSPGIAGNATEEEAADLLSRQADTGRIVDPARTPQRNISLRYIDSADEIQRQLDDIAISKDLTGDPVMQPQTWAETQLKANEAELDLREIFGNDKKLTLPKDAGEIIAMRDLMTSSSEELVEMSNNLLVTDPVSGVRSLRPDVTPQEMFDYRKAINAHTAIQMHFMGQAKELGRALNALKMPNGAPMIPTEDLMKMSDPANLRQVAALIADAKSPADIAGATRAHWAKRTGGMMYEYWINNLLGSVGTHTKNLIGNTMTSIMALPEHYIAAGFGAARRKLGGSADAIQMNEVNAMAYGMWQGLGDGLSAGFNRLRVDQGDTGLIDPSHAKMEYFRKPQFTAANMSLDETGYLGKTVDFLGKWYVRLPGRFLEAEDELFRSVGYRMQLNRSAYATASREGNAPGTKEFYARVTELINEPPEDIHADALHFSRYQTFTNDLVGNTAEAAQMFQQTPLGRFMIPFLRTPVNILKYGLARTPVGWVMPSVMKDLKAGGHAADLAMSRMTMGSFISGTMVLTSNNYTEDGVYRPAITGAGPSNYKQAALWREYGIQPYAIYNEETDSYVPYDILEPFGTVLATMADAVEVYNHTHDPEVQQEVISAMIVGLAEYTTEKSYMQGVTQLMDMLRGRGVGSTMTNIVTSLSPTSTVSAGRLARDIDPVKRETKNVPSAFGTGAAIDTWLGQTIASIKSKTPTLSDSLKPKTDMFGEDVLWDEPIFKFHSISPGMYSPMRRDKDAPLMRELVANGIGERKPEAVVTYQTRYGVVTVDLLNNHMDIPGDDLFYEYRQLVGRSRRAQVLAAVNSPGYRSLADGAPERKYILGAALDRGLEQAKAEMQKKYPKMVPSTLRDAEQKGVNIKRSLPAGLPDTKYKEITY